MLSGADKRLTAFYELGLFVAWHTAAFTHHAQNGKLEPFATYRRKLLGTSSPASAPAPQDWRVRKAERQAQMELYKQHQRARKRPIKVRRG